MSYLQSKYKSVKGADFFRGNAKYADFFFFKIRKLATTKKLLRKKNHTKSNFY